MLAGLGFILLGLSLVSVWFHRDVKIWGLLFILSLVVGLSSGYVYWEGLLIVALWAIAWVTYSKIETPQPKLLFFAALVFLSFGFKLHLFPGFNPMKITPRFYLGYMAPVIGLFPLALLVPLASAKRDWKAVFTKGLGYSLAGIGCLALLALITGSTQWIFKWPSHPGVRILSNLVLVAIPEEAFFRGFIQRELCSFLPGTKQGKVIALVITSLLFSLAHIYWSPSLAILGFVFMASMLYGWVYLATGKIESAILCHFLLNFIHMTFFSYHAM